MSIPVLLFASYADAFGTRKLNAPIGAPCDVAALVNSLRALPGGSRLPAQPLVALNRKWAASNATVQIGDEVALIPPVAGG